MGQVVAYLIWIRAIKLSRNKNLKIKLKILQLIIVAIKTFKPKTKT